MNKTSIFAILLSLLFVACGKVDGDGIITKEKLAVSETAKKLDVSSEIQLILTKEIKPGELRVETFENIHKYVVIEDFSTELNISMNGNKDYDGVTVIVFASLDQYNELTVSGGSIIEVIDSTLSVDELMVDLSGRSSFIGDVKVENKAEFIMSGASIVEVTGEAKSVDMEVFGESQFSDFEFTCGNLNVDIYGESVVSLSVENKIVGEISGGSILKYKGTAEVEVETSESSVVEKQ